MSPKGGGLRVFHGNSALVFNTKLKQLGKYTIAAQRENYPAFKVVLTELTRNGRKVSVVLGKKATVLEVGRKQLCPAGAALGKKPRVVSSEFRHSS